MVAVNQFEPGSWLRRCPSAPRSGETYDLIVVGGGLSGLAAAHFFLKDTGRQARVLVLDNHDDFGGHAKRNELTYQGKLLAINGGTLEIESPSRYNQWAMGLYDPMEWVFTETASRPCVIARQPYGLISIANADAAASPHTDAAILEAHRAVGEVLERRAFPFVPRDIKSSRS